MLQTSKWLFEKTAGHSRSYDINLNLNNHQNSFDAMDQTVDDDTNVVDKNPIINKRILLQNDRKTMATSVNVESNDIESDFVPFDPIDGGAGGNLEENAFPNHIEVSEEIKNQQSETNQTNAEAHTADATSNILVRKKDKIILDKIKYGKQTSAFGAAVKQKHGKNQATDADGNNQQSQQSNEGRIVVYGDSNCLDSTHIEKPCFWLLDALLEYTMTSHVSNLLRDLNRSATIKFDSHPNDIPKRLPNNNLHMYSKVLMAAANVNDVPAENVVSNEIYGSPTVTVKRDIAKCIKLEWETPVFLNITAPIDFQNQNGRQKDDSDAEGANIMGELNLRRKLESQKGEVCSDE